MVKIHYLIVSLFFFSVSYNILFREKIILGIYGKSIIPLGEKLIIAIPTILTGLILLIFFFKTKYKKEVEHSKCPKSKQT